MVAPFTFVLLLSNVYPHVVALLFCPSVVFLLWFVFHILTLVSLVSYCEMENNEEKSESAKPFWSTSF